MTKYKRNVEFKYGNLPDSRFNKQSLIKGTNIEEEHTNLKYIAKQIAKAHLVENPLYYSDKNIGKKGYIEKLKSYKK